MTIKVSRGGSYVPQWGNESRDESEKITIRYQFLSFAEQQELLRPEDLGKSFAYESRILARMVREVINLSVEVDGETIEVTDGAALVGTPGLDALAMEVWLHLREQQAVDKKK